MDVEVMENDCGFIMSIDWRRGLQSISPCRLKECQFSYKRISRKYFSQMNPFIPSNETMRKGENNLSNNLQSIHNVDRDCINYMYVMWSKLLDGDYMCVYNNVSLSALIAHLGNKVSHQLCLRSTCLSNVKWAPLLQGFSASAVS